MALQVWLPLNGNLNNQGLADVTISSNGSTLINDGKIGKCYKNANCSITNLNGLKVFPMTICFWAKTDATTSWQKIVMIDDNNLSQIHGVYIADSARLKYEYSPSVNINDSATSEWHHYAFTINNGESIGYYDGIQKQVSTESITADVIGRLRIGTSGSVYLNDVRVYDNCLSSREIKEISKGLVLHYPLSMPGQENLLSIQISDNHWVNWGSSAWNTNNSREKIVGDDGKTWAHIIQNTTDGYGGYACDPAYNNIVIDPSKRYTWSCIAKSGTKENAEIVLWCHWRSTEGGANLSQNTKKFLLTSNPQRISWTLPQYTNATYTVNRINLMMGTSGTGNNEIYFTDVKFEEGEIATPWIPNPADPLYSQLGLDDGVEYDVSGFGNNGTKVGTLSYSSDTPRYFSATHFSAEDQKIHISNFPTSGFGDSYSFAWWAKVKSFGPMHMHWGFSDGIRLNGMYTGRLWNTGDSSSNPLYIPGTTTQVTAPSTNVWHHYVMTGDGTICKVYLDGVLWAEAKTYKSISGTSIFINGWSSSTQYSSDDSTMSDFRIYSTALSPDDVLELYHTSASLADNGTLFAYEFNEG